MPRPFRSALAAMLVVASCSISIAACDGEQTPLVVQTQTFLSKTYVIDQVYRSMKGPQDLEVIKIGGDGPPERIWIISYKTEIVDPRTGELESEEFMCHNNLGFDDLLRHQRGLGSQPNARMSPRIFTLSQGAMNVEFPEGFGVPMMSNETLKLGTQILNLNPINQTREIQYRTTVRYVRNEDAIGRVRPLFQRGLQGLKLIDGRDGYFGVEHGDEEVHGEGCAVGELASKRTIRDGQGRSFAAHWVVEPGREENHTLVSKMLALNQDTVVHYIAVHLHPFAETLELRDLTSGETIFKSRATNSEGRIGLDHVEYFSSEEGIPLYKDHEYTLISVYDNTSDQQQDAMAVMFVYMVDNNFEKKLLASN